jgi:hypothetical protein
MPKIAVMIIPTKIAEIQGNKILSFNVSLINSLIGRMVKES